MTTTVPCIAGISYAFAAESHSLPELAEAGLLQSGSDVLQRFGFERVFIAAQESPYELGLRAAADLLAERGIDPESVDLLIYTGTPGTPAFAAPESPNGESNFWRTTERFRLPATRMQYDLGLNRASVLALDQLACTGLFGAIRVARAMCMAEGLDRVLCVSAEFFPADAGREAIFNCTSDAACAVLVERGGERNRLVACTHTTKGYYWDGDALRDEIIASYFPTARYVIDSTIRKAGWCAEELDWIVPHNVSLRSWEILLSLTGLCTTNIWSSNIARHGHTLAGDNFINLRDAVDSGAIRPGQKLLLFSYGYGAHWTGLAIEA